MIWELRGKKHVEMELYTINFIFSIVLIFNKMCE